MTSTFRIDKRALLLGAAGCLLMSGSGHQPLSASPGPAVTFTNVDEFVNRTAARLDSTQAKLTWLGPQKKPINTVAFGTFRRIVDVPGFQALRKPGLDYSNDDTISIENFSVTTEQLHNLIQAAATVPAFAAGQRSGKLVSFMIMDNGTVGARGTEVILDKAESKKLVRMLHQALLGRNPLGASILETFSRRALS